MGCFFAIIRRVVVVQGDFTQIVVLIEQGIGVQCLLDFGLQFERRSLQQSNCLLQLRRHLEVLTNS